MPPRPDADASMRFLFVRPALCLQLPSDPALRRRPCCSASGSHHQGPQRTFTSKSSVGYHPDQTAPCGATRHAWRTNFHFDARVCFVEDFGDAEVDYLLIVLPYDSGERVQEALDVVDYRPRGSRAPRRLNSNSSSSEGRGRKPRAQPEYISDRPCLCPPTPRMARRRKALARHFR